MRRVVSVWFPTLPTDRFRRPEEGQGTALNPQRAGGPLNPFMDVVPRADRLWWGSGQRPDLPMVTVTARVITAVNAEAAALGLRPGMKLAQAQALVPGLAVHDADPAGDAALLRRLAEWCLRYAPLAAAGSAGWAVDRCHRQHPSAWRRDPAAARSGVAGCSARDWWRGRPLPIRRLSRMRWPGLAPAAWCRRGPMSWPGSRSRRCACRPRCWPICG